MKITFKINHQVLFGQTICICGSLPELGQCDENKAVNMVNKSASVWELTIEIAETKAFEYYYIVKENNHIIVKEWGKPRNVKPTKNQDCNLEDYWIIWKTGGVAIPVFSLRSEKSFGVGEFSDLIKMIDWAKTTGMKFIQVLPINDTTITHKWTDSYPYNAISIYALHPIYLGLHKFPLKDKTLFSEYKKKAAQLNALKDLDYEQVINLKTTYLSDLFKEQGKEILQSKAYREFVAKNEEWLFPYACFTYFRDVYKTADYSIWKMHNKYNKTELTNLLEENKAMKKCVELACFTQYLLDKQLVEVKKYAQKNGVSLKGDVPIGISRNSVEAWTEPTLFNLDTQTGAPPDFFSAYGQNWGFPTYNWNEMAKDGYQWWIKRFKKMADYFDAYRIDHILGFFRIWEIPLHAVQGLLGYFSPALPFTTDELNDCGFVFDENRMTKPYIHKHFLPEIFGEYTEKVISEYLTPICDWRYELKDFCDTQKKIQALFNDKNDEESNTLRAGLYDLCNEVLFIRDKREPSTFHPRIMGQTSRAFAHLDNAQKAAFEKLYYHFFYHRHNQFWSEQAMKKLPALIAATDMLVCGEDLGMIPDCVPQVMKELQILSLEIQRMPKDINHAFENLSTIPYMSVCTTSTHDMSPTRMWWRENKDITQQFYNEILWKQGAAPEDCTPELCWQIVVNHLNAPDMLTIIPLQDWLAIDEKLRRPNPMEERINDPAVAQFYWRYRMHLTIEELLKAEDFNNRIKEMLMDSGR